MLSRGSLTLLALTSLSCSLTLPPAPAVGGNGGSGAAGSGMPGAGGANGGSGSGRGGAGTAGSGAAGAVGSAGAVGTAGAGGSTGSGGAGNQTWRAPAMMDVGKSPRVAMGGSNAALVWVTLDQSWQVYGRLYKDAGGWGAATRLQGQFANQWTDGDKPVVAMNAHGVAIVAWKQGGNGGTLEPDGAFNFRLPVPPSQGDGWSTPGATTTGWGMADPAVSLGMNDANDRGLWISGDTAYLQAHDFVGIGTSGPGTSINFPGNDVSCPSVSTNLRGDSMAAWVEMPSSGAWIVVARLWIPMTSLPPDPITLGSGDPELIGCPKVALDDLGRALAVWTVTTNGTSRITYRTYDPNTKWAAATTIDMGALSAFNPQLALSTTGEGAIVWEQATTADAASPRDICALHLQLGRGADANGPQPAGSTPPAAAPRVVVAGTGTVAAVWTQAGRIVANTFTASGGWGGASPIDTPRNLYVSQNPDLATDGKGRALAAWESTTGAVPDIFVARFE